MKATIYISGKIGKETTLVDVIRQFKSFEDATEVEAVIHSEGGNVEEGEAIYDYLKGLDAEIPVTTSTDKAYSIAAKIFAAGRERIVEDTDKALMIHFAWAKAEGNADKFEAIAEALRELEDEFASFYASFLDIDEDTVRNLLDNETFVSGSEAVELGFATKVKVTAEAVAEFNINNNSKFEKMTEKSMKKKGLALLQAMAEFVGVELKTGEKVEVNAELTLQDSNGTEIVFPDLDSGDTPKVGDAATIDGSAIPDGSYVMPSLEEATVVFVDGKISEIVPKEDPEEEETEASKKNGKDKGKPEVNAEEIKEVSVWSVEVSNTTFEVGETVMYQYDGESYPVSAGEFRLNDGTKIVTDASGVIVSKEEGTTADPTVETEASFDDLLEKVTEKVNSKVRAEIVAEFEGKLTEKEDEIKALKAKIGGKEINAEEKEVETSGKGKEANYQASVLLRRTKQS